MIKSNNKFNKGTLFSDMSVANYYLLCKINEILHYLKQQWWIIRLKY